MQGLAQLVWYAIPGGVVMGSVLLASPICGGRLTALVIAAAPIVGFAINQVARAVTDPLSTHPASRPVLGRILNVTGFAGPGTPGRWARRLWFELIFRDECPRELCNRNRRDSQMFIAIVSLIISIAVGWFVVGFVGGSSDCLEVTGLGFLRRWLRATASLAIAFLSFWAWYQWTELVRFELLIYDAIVAGRAPLGGDPAGLNPVIGGPGGLIAGFIAGFAIGLGLGT